MTTDPTVEEPNEGEIVTPEQMVETYAVETFGQKLDREDQPYAIMRYDIWPPMAQWNRQRMFVESQAAGVPTGVAK